MEAQYFLRYPVPRVETFVGTLDEVYGTGCYDVELILMWKKVGDTYTLHRRIRTADVFERWEERPREEGVFLFDLVRVEYKREVADPPLCQEKLNMIASIRCANNPRVLPEQFTYVRWDRNDSDSATNRRLKDIQADEDKCKARLELTGALAPRTRCYIEDRNFEWDWYTVIYPGVPAEL
jgi:hypothetical protein